jgi:transcriptional regulator NrdR family protein
MRLGSVPAATGEWECMECGHVEEGVQAKRPRECSECGAPATAFEFFAYDDADEEEWESDDEGSEYEDARADDGDEDFDEEDEDY